MNLSQMPDEVLLNSTKKLARDEREVLGQILHHIREIERRRLYCTLSCGSLFQYATKILGYSEDQAYRRIQAMKLLKEIPEIEEKIQNGVLNLTHIGTAQSLFIREEKSGEKSFSRDQKIELLKKLEGTSKREAEKIVMSHSDVPVPSTEKIKTVSEKLVEIRFTASKDLLEKIEKLKGLLAHKDPRLKLEQLIHQLCDLGLEKWDRNVKPIDFPAPARVTSTKSKAQVRRLVWQRDRGACSNCGSQYALEFDHQKPKASGGEDTMENLRILCRTCNQRAAIEKFGQNKMDRYL